MQTLLFLPFLFLSLLGIRDILVRYLWQMDPIPTPDPNPFFINFKDGKKKYFFPIPKEKIFFPILSYILPTGTSSSAKKI